MASLWALPLLLLTHLALGCQGVRWNATSDEEAEMLAIAREAEQEEAVSRHLATSTSTEGQNPLPHQASTSSSSNSVPVLHTLGNLEPADRTQILDELIAGLDPAEVAHGLRAQLRNDGWSQTEITTSAQRLIMHLLDQVEEGEESEEETQDRCVETEAASLRPQEPRQALGTESMASANGAATCVTHTRHRSRSACRSTRSPPQTPTTRILGASLVTFPFL